MRPLLVDLSPWCPALLFALVVVGCSSDGAKVAGANSSGGQGGADANDAGADGSTAGPDASASGGEAGSSDAGASGTGGGPTSGGTVDPPITPRVNDCSGLPAEGVFEEITPPEVKRTMASTQDGGGTFAIAIDPVNLGTIYVGTRYQKLWKSTDCGSTWVSLSESGLAATVGTGMNWTLAVDPQDPQVLYTNSGYAKGSSGLYKSKNGGTDFELIWPPASQPELAKAFTYQFANVVALDPKNHLHVLLTFHEACLPPHPATCIAESYDGGESWKLIDGEPGWNGSEGQVIFFLENASTWLWGSQTNGFWRTEDSGASWQEIKGMTTSHLQGSQLVRSKSGQFYQAAADGIWHSPDGKASTWKLIADTGPIVGGLVSTGETMYASTCYFPGFCNPRYLFSAENDGQTWKALKSPTLSQGGTLAYDPGHKLLYSSNLEAGLFRVVVK